MRPRRAGRRGAPRAAALLAAATAFAAGAGVGDVRAQQCTVVGPLPSGALALVVGADTMVALTRQEYADVTRRLIKLDNALEMIEQLEAVREETASYLDAVDRQNAVADSLIAAQRAQIADYERLTTLLERLANRGRVLSAELGAGYTADGHLTGIAGLGLGPVRVLGLLQQEDVGFLVAGWVPIW